jgi:hypothetical protein
MRQVDGRQSALAELALEAVAVGEVCPEALEGHAATSLVPCPEETAARRALEPVMSASGASGLD